MTATEEISRYAEYREQPEALIGLLVEKDHEILKLQNILHKLQKEQFGSKSEKLSRVSDNQLPLLPEEVIEAPRVEPQTIGVAAHERAARKQRDLSALPHNRTVYEPESKLCPCCGKELSQIGEDVSKELEHQPARLFVNEHVRPRYACGICKNAVIQAELPSTIKPLERAVAGPGLLAHVIVSKYVDHLPLHRQEQIFARKGVSVPRRILSDWVAATVDQYLNRLWQALQAEMFEESYLQGDDDT